jgi:hypothetical protein
MPIDGKSELLTCRIPNGSLIRSRWTVRNGSTTARVEDTRECFGRDWGTSCREKSIGCRMSIMDGNRRDDRSVDTNSTSLLLPSHNSVTVQARGIARRISTTPTQPI